MATAAFSPTLGVRDKGQFLGPPTNFEFDFPVNLSASVSSKMNASNDVLYIFFLELLVDHKRQR